MGLAALLLSGAVPPPLPPVPQCVELTTFAGRKVRRGEPARECIDLEAPRLYEGLWLDDFEGQLFAEGIGEVREIDRRKGYAWLEAGALRGPADCGPSTGVGHAYKVRFVGRQARDMNAGPMPFGYGHMGGSPGLIVVEKTLSCEDLGAMKPQLL